MRQRVSRGRCVLAVDRLGMSGPAWRQLPG